MTVTATDEVGETATLRFQVAVSPDAPGRWRGWRFHRRTAGAAQQAAVQ